MVVKEPIAARLEEAVLQPDAQQLREALDQAAALTLPAREVLAALSRGMDRARLRARGPHRSIPELILSVEVFRAGIDWLRTRREAESLAPSSAPRPTIVIGVVAGDVHDMGKRIVAAVLEASGYPVVDLGCDVACDEFLGAVERHEPALLALSAMMSTALDELRDVVRQVHRQFPDVPVLVGGACLEAPLAAALGADGFGESAITAPNDVARLLHR